MPGKKDLITPLNKLITILQQEGFDVSTRTILDIQKVLANLDEKEVNDTANLKHLLGPLICRNKEEQDKFYKIFDQYEERLREEGFKEVTTTGNSKRKFIVKTPFIIIAAISVLLLSYFLFVFPYPFRPKEKEKILFRQAAVPAGFVYTVNEPVPFAVSLEDTSRKKKYSVNWKVGDRTYPDSREISVSFSKPGVQKVIATLVNNKGNDIVTAETTIEIFEKKQTSLKIFRDTTARNSNINAKSYASELINASAQASYHYTWYINDSSTSHISTFSTGYTSLKPYVIRLKVESIDNKKTDSLFAELPEDADAKLQVNGIEPLALQKSANWGNISLLFLFSIVVPGAVSVFLYRKKVKKDLNKKLSPEKKKVPGAATLATKEFTGPYNIEFKSQEDKIFDEEGINKLAGILRQRHVSEVYKLNVRRTIKSTIGKGGFPSFQFTPRTEPMDFLFLIDKEYPESHLIKLFEYLTGKLRKEQVNLAVYSYYKEPLLLNNEKLNHKLVPLDRVARLYPKTILLLFTNADAFFKPLDVQLKDWVVEKFKSWETKIIVTPVSSEDWGAKELALYKAGFTVVPADMNAQQVISDEINKMIDRQKLKKEIVPGAYSSTLINFNHWSDIENYLRKSAAKNSELYNTPDQLPLLKQWLCALAVYPHLDWDLTIAIGKALEEKFAKPGQLVNYTNLLVLSRISWMQDGQLTDTLKLEMLNQLDNETEVIARETIIELLSEIEDEIGENSLVADEFRINKVTNSFLLRHHRKEITSATDEDYQGMKDLVDKQSLDWSSEIYLNSPSSNSLFRQPEVTGPGATLKNYFNAQDIENAKKIKKHKQFWQRAATGLFLLLAALSSVLMYVGDKKPVTLPTKADRMFIIPRAKNPNLDLQSFTLQVGDKNYVPSIVSDTTILFHNVPVEKESADINEIRLVPISYISLKDDDGYDLKTDVPLRFKTYELSLGEPTKKLPLIIHTNNSKAFENIRQALLENIPGFDVTVIQSTFDDSSKIIYHNQEQRDNSISIIQKLKSSFNMNVLGEEDSKQSLQPLSLYLNLNEKTCKNIPVSSLPRRLSEIWKGKTNNRLVTINLSSQLIYYSTGDKKTYGTYRISEICYDNAGVYKLILSTGKEYVLALIKNISGNSLDISLCPNRFSSKEEARGAGAECQEFDRIEPYYETDPDKIYFTYLTQNLGAQQQNKLRSIVKNSEKKFQNPEYSLITNTNSLSEKPVNLSKKAMSALTNIDENNIADYPLGRSILSATPFDRSYLQVKASEGKPPVEEDKPFVEIMTIEFSRPGDLSSSYVPQLVNLKNYLLKNSRAKLQIVAYYSYDSELSSNYPAMNLKAISQYLPASQFKGQIEEKTQRTNLRAGPSKNSLSTEFRINQVRKTRVVIFGSGIPTNLGPRQTN